MLLGALAPVGIFVIVAGAVAIRLLRLWRQTRSLPELSIGAGLGCVALLGLPLSAAGRSAHLIATPVGQISFTLAMLAVVVGIFLLYMFTWTVYRRDAPWARVLLVCVGLSLVATGAGSAVTNLQGGSLEAILQRALPFRLGTVALVCTCFVWTAAESTIYFRSARRRRDIGLADPVVTNRFLLWAVGSWTTALLCGGLLLAAANGIAIVRDTRALYGIACAGLVMSTTWYLTFFAPERYRAWIEARHAAIAMTLGSEGDAA